LITFTCYGTWLRGDERGSIDRHHNLPGSRVLTPDANRVQGDHERMNQSAYHLDDTRRELVREAIREVCEHRRWPLFALHVRAEHVHCVVASSQDPERVMNDFKVYCTRALNRSGVDPPDRKRWTRHGSTRKLWTHADVEAAIRYVVHEQGDPMAVFLDNSALVKIENELEKVRRQEDRTSR
jgi:REP element-mobilizing transposase RayT